MSRDLPPPTPIRPLQPQPSESERGATSLRDLGLAPRGVEDVMHPLHLRVEGPTPWGVFGIWQAVEHAELRQMGSRAIEAFATDQWRLALLQQPRVRAYAAGIGRDQQVPLQRPDLRWYLAGEAAFLQANEAARSRD